MNSGLNVDTNVIHNQNVEQSNQAIDKKYNISIFENIDDQYQLYDLETVNNVMFQDTNQYQLEVSQDRFSLFFNEPIIYSMNNKAQLSSFTGILVLIMLVQIIIVIYFIKKILLVKRRKNEEHSIQI